MPKPRQLANRKWQVQIKRNGKRVSKTFDKVSEAKNWLAQTEYELINSKAANTPKISVSELFDQYEEKVVPTKKGKRWESVRFKKLKRENWASKQIDELRTADFDDWVRSETKRGLKPSSIRREIVLIKAVFTWAKDTLEIEFKNPLDTLKMPTSSPKRTRRIHNEEIARLISVSGFDGINAETENQRVMVAFLFAIETGCRAGEIAKLKNDDIEGSVALLRDTKNGQDRKVPLSPEAIRLLNTLPKSDKLFDLESCEVRSAGDLLSRKFGALRDKAKIEDLKFHDSRHEAITRLSKRLGVLELARMIGHNNINELMTYYDESPENIAAKLAG